MLVELNQNDFKRQLSRLPEPLQERLTLGALQRDIEPEEYLALIFDEFGGDQSEFWSLIGEESQEKAAAKVVSLEDYRMKKAV